jgi:hypothetical protein
VPTTTITTSLWCFFILCGWGHRRRLQADCTYRHRVESLHPLLSTHTHAPFSFTLSLSPNL